MPILWRTRLDRTYFFRRCFLLKISCNHGFLLNRQIKNIYLGFFPILPIKNFWKKSTSPCFMLAILSEQLLTYTTIILFSSQILSVKSLLITGYSGWVIIIIKSLFIFYLQIAFKFIKFVTVKNVLYCTVLYKGLCVSIKDIFSQK